MENSTEMSGHQIDNNKKPYESICEANKQFFDNEKDINNKSMCNENNNTVNQTLASVAVPVNPVKVVPSEPVTLPTQQPHHNINENGKLSHRRNTVQPNLQPLLKKPINNISTTKPLLLPAPISDSYTQGTKTNIVTMHSNYSTSSVSSQFNNCQQQMAMGIATIQPQHFGYSGLSNNRYPMMPISLQNSYSTQQLTIANGSLGTAVQLMPVMNQNNNQMNNSRVQPVPLFMTPIIGAHSGMLFQPNMALMPQTSNTMQTISIPNSTYSNEYNPGITLQSQPMYSSSIRNTTVFTTDCENVLKQDVDSNKLPTVPVQNIDKPETEISSKVNKIQSEVEPIVTVRTNVKHRELIRTQIYRMKVPTEESPVIKLQISPEPVIIRQSTPIPITPEEIPVAIEENKIEIDQTVEIENKIEKNKEDVILAPEIKSTISNEITIPEKPLATITNSISESDNEKNTPIEPKPTTPVPLPLKRKLPSPEILEESEPAKKLYKNLNIDEKVDCEQKSPISLFEKLCKDNPERQNSVFSQNSRQSNKLTAVVRPEQRKVLVHYLDDLIVFESDVPFPTTNKMQVVKSALKAGNIKLNSQKSKLFTDHFLYTNTDDEMSPNQHKQKLNKHNYNHQVLNTKNDSCMEPLSIDIPTTNTTSSCGSVDSSQVRPLSVCSRRSPTPIPVSMKRISKDNSPKKDVNISSPPKEDKIKRIAIQEPKPIVMSEVIEQPITILNNSTNKDSIPVKQVSPVKQKPQKVGLDRPICEWSVNDVADFVKQTPGCDNYVAMFQNHEIDGEALLLLSNDNLIQGALNMKIGPALKLCARIEKRKALDPPQQ